MEHPGFVEKLMRDQEPCKCGNCADCTIERLEKLNERLKKALRFQYLTLGYYSTPFNYDKANWTYHPITGQLASGIMCDGGQDAREAMEHTEKLGFSGDEIRSW